MPLKMTHLEVEKFSVFKSCVRSQWYFLIIPSNCDNCNGEIAIKGFLVFIIEKQVSKSKVAIPCCLNSGITYSKSIENVSLGYVKTRTPTTFLPFVATSKSLFPFKTVGTIFRGVNNNRFTLEQALTKLWER